MKVLQVWNDMRVINDRIVFLFSFFNTLIAILVTSWLKGAIWCDFKFFFLFGVLQADRV